MSGYCEEEAARVYWVTPLASTNKIQETFLVYGNEPDLDCTYGHICLITELPPFEVRKNTLDRPAQ